MSVRDAIERGGFDEWAAALAPDVVWVGVLPGQLCRSREEVLATFRAALEAGRTAWPEIVTERDDTLVVDPHVEPPPDRNPGLHQVLTVRDDLIVELRDYSDRAAALTALDELARWDD
jgi:ketosteroid isomerase-like protein